MSESLFDEVRQILQGEHRRGTDWYDADCPFCGKESKRGQVHFSYSDSGGYHCFVCGASGNLRALADRLNVGSDNEWKPMPRKEQAPKPVARWRQNPDRLLDEYTHHPDRYRLWAQHKPLKPETVDRFGFGVGRLPRLGDSGEWELAKVNRLIVPIWSGGQLMALRGRAMQPDIEPKWLSAAQSVMTPWGLGNITPGGIVWIAENYVDAAWLMQERQGEYAIGLGTAGGWKEENTWALARLKPHLVIVALDNDLPGQAQGALRKRLEDEWRADPKHRGQRPPPSNGVRMVSELRSMGLRTELFQWPEDAPAKAGLDWMLSGGKQQ